MNNDRGWMYQRKVKGYLNPAFVKGLENFMQHVISLPSSFNGTNIQCPCSKCRHIGGFWDAETVKLHLLKNGFVSDYYVWSRHGESYISGQSGEQSSPYHSNTQDRTDEDNLMYNMVMDAAGPSFDPEMPNAETKKLYDILKSSERKLYEGCETSQLSAMAQMLSLKADHHLSEACYDQTSQFIKGILPQDNTFLDSFSGTKKYMEDLGLPSEQIDCCVNGSCPHCAHDHDAYNLSHGGKTTWFDNHRKFLPANHPFRKNKNWFTKGKTVTESPPPVRTGVPAHSVQHVQAESGQNIHAHSEQGTGQRVQAHTGQSFAARSLSRPDLQIRVPSQSILHSPTQSGQRTSLSAQSTPNESLQLSAQSRQHTPEAQSHPSTLNVSSTAANDNVCWNMGSTQKDGRIRIEVIEKRLEPSFDCSTKIREIMFENLEPTGYNWKSLSEETKKFYFEEFKKHSVWRQSDAIIYKSWLSSARTKYSEFVSVARSNWEYYNRRDNRIGLNVYLSWVKFWETETFKKKSLVQKNNRRSGVDGPSRHTSGSASHRLVAARLKRQFKRDPTADEVFFEAHTRHLKKRKYPIGEAGDIGMDDEDDEDEVIWIDKKSQQKYEIVLELVELMEKSGQPVDRNALFLEAVGGPDKKNRVPAGGKLADLGVLEDGRGQIILLALEGWETISDKEKLNG
ncbi:hypothetical protein POM88_002560 [Heracleum sosnowskyi]|uniref:Transposase-associated domain-containing protein n=1 Tax=Heracleum sosnowskyi TaxID=360622 RepID=A0AAD8JIN5_9APIA|nr:hypothetical protein POM88_002560 [Heracleum sosnowskyi]